MLGQAKAAVRRSLPVVWDLERGAETQTALGLARTYTTVASVRLRCRPAKAEEAVVEDVDTAGRTVYVGVVESTLSVGLKDRFRHRTSGLVLEVAGVMADPAGQAAERRLLLLG